MSQCSLDIFRPAGNYGSRKRSGGVSTLVCAVLDDRNPDDDEEPKYVSACLFAGIRLYLGLSDTAHSFVSVRGSHLQIMSGSETSLGKYGIPRIHLVSCRLRSDRMMIRETYILNQRSKCPIRRRFRYALYDLTYWDCNLELFHPQGQGC